MSDATAEAFHVRVDEPPSAPDEADRFRRRVRLPAAMRALWQSKEMAWSLAEREMRARYKQTFLGIAWAVITPITLMLVFTVFFRRVANVETGDVPYALFAYLGLLPWGFFSMTVGTGGISLIQNVSLVNKVSFPREVFPIGSMTLAMVDTLIAVSALILLFAINGFAPKAETVWLPVLWLVLIAFTLGITLIVSSVVVYLRDLAGTLSLLLQLGLFATPVAYGLDKIPKSWRPYYVVLNPMAAVIDGARRTVLLGLPPQWGLVGLAAASSFVILLIGYMLFKRLETGFADVA